MEETQRANRKEQLATKLKRLCPGASTSLAAVQDAAGTIHTDPPAMAAALAAHWSKIFAGSPIDTAAL